MANSLVTPVIDLLHPDLVDADGQLIQGDPRPGLFAARSSIPFHTNGIYLSDEEYAAVFATPETHEVFKVGADQSFKKLERIIRIVSQRDIGSDLLSTAYRQKTNIDLRKEGLTKNGGAYSEYSNTIMIHPDSDWAIMVLIAVHELEHAAHCKGRLKTDSQDSLATSLQKSRIKEAAARTAVALFVYQIPQPPYWDGNQAEIMRAFEQEDSYMALHAKKFSHLAKQGDWTGFAREMFDAASRDLHNLSSYDAREIQSSIDGLAKLTYVPRMGQQTLIEESQGKFLSQSVSQPDDLTDMVKIMGRHYIDPDYVKKPEFKELTPWQDVLALQAEFSQAAAMANNLYGLQIDFDIPRPGFKMMARCYEFDRLSTKHNVPEGMPVDVPKYDMKMGARYIAKRTKLKLSGRI